MSHSDRSTPGHIWFARDSAADALRLRERHTVAMTDLFLPPEGRLRDDDRATIARLLADIVSGIEHDLRGRLGHWFTDRPMLAESLLSPRIEIVRPILERVGGLRDAELVAALARRAEEARTVARLRRARERSRAIDTHAGASPLEPLGTDADGAVARAAHALILAEQQRRDPTGAPILGPAELPAEVQHRLVWRTAAALRTYIVASEAVTASEADPLIARAASAVLAGYDEGMTLPALALALARALAGRLEDGLIATALAAGHAGFAVAALARRAGIGWETAWDMALAPARLLPLCRAAGVGARAAAELALHLADEGDDEALADRLDGYEALTPADAIAGIGLWRLDPAYLDSIAALAAEAAR